MQRQMELIFHSAIGGVSELSGEEIWYMLGGQRISRPCASGLYIRNGQKVIVK